MSNFLISTMPAVGHVNPILQTAAKLVERGHEVWWHTGPEAAQKIKAAVPDEKASRQIRRNQP